jgi:hypothetical protein
MNPHITAICNIIREYQKNNNITDQCMTNTQFLYTFIKDNFPNMDVKAKAVICCADIGNDTIKNIIHLMIVVDGQYYEPSYDTYHLQGRKYFTTIKDLLDGFVPNKLIKDNLKDIITPYLHFVDIEKRINDGEFLICDMDLYDNYIDCIDEFFKSLGATTIRVAELIN